jgi:hypothetical protein
VRSEHLTHRGLRYRPLAGVTAAVGLAGALTYSDWLVLEPATGWPLSPVRSYLSELGASSTPRHTVANVLEALSGLCVLLFAIGLRHVLPPARGTRPGAIALGAFGVATLLTGRWPMTCAPSRDPSCSAGGLALHAPAQDLATTGLSVAANLAILAGMYWITIGLAGAPGWRRAATRSRLLLLTSAPLQLAVAALAMFNGNVGLPQRALVLVQSAWIAVLALATARHGQARILRRGLPAGPGVAQPVGPDTEGRWRAWRIACSAIAGTPAAS